MREPELTREAVHQELEDARLVFHRLVAVASAADLRRRSDGTRWTNAQLLFHMAFGYLIVLRLLPLVRLFGRLPRAWSRTFARVLSSATGPFHVVNYLGSCAGALVFHDRRLLALFDHTIDALHRRLDRETDVDLDRRMCFPADWDPFFTDTMTLLEVYHFGTQHFGFHARQLTVQRVRIARQR